MRSAAQFSAAFRTGRSARSGEIRVVCAAGARGIPQVGIVASRRVGGAVARNRARRRLREALLRVELMPDTAYVVIASAGAGTMDFEELVSELGSAIAASREEKNR
ncbi:MAG: ribonuclease P protein component [Actinomycetota bacterium]|nr:ribonuclease P protein component [Actinomycetota bacterium]